MFKLTNMILPTYSEAGVLCPTWGTTLEKKFIHLKIFIELYMKNHTLQWEHKDE